jgi:uncharacterized membrane-anchored protein YhcB (DUF1043 family)
MSKTANIDDVEARVAEEFGDQEELLKMLHERLAELEERAEQVHQNISQSKEDLERLARGVSSIAQSQLNPESIQDINEGLESQKTIERTMEDMGIELDEIRSEFVTQAEETEAAINILKEEMEEFNKAEELIEGLNNLRESKLPMN